MIDAHCHIHWNADLPRIVSEARESNVQQVICNATTEADWTEVLGLKDVYGDFVIPSLGIHPWFCENLAEGWLDRLRAKLLERTDVLIGEIGIDHYSSKRPPKPLQSAVLASQLSLASSLCRPFSVHCVRAHKPFLKLLQQHVSSPTPFLMHSWSGSPSDLRNLLLAFPQQAYISLSQHSLTDEGVLPGVKDLPRDRILVETDSPCLCKPEFLLRYGVVPGVDGKGEPVNEPKYVAWGVKRVAEVRGEEEQALMMDVRENTRRFVGRLSVS